jgi:F420-non-reducing hydrogenase iron-sulfur subunit
MDPSYAIEALQNGADGVIIGACHIGDCHYLEGNMKMVRRFSVLDTYITQLGIHPKRIQFWHISASEGAEFTERIKEYVEEIKEIGPNELFTAPEATIHD